ncbi:MULTISPECIES: very short patch repair endonuclease [unclassified Mesorhizobium]|uniref:very short patch repair endonuclease n=1 Tax=unclassified Mesorhizobium TaxID=325217 RepID=UPI00112E5D63|nr:MULTISPECIES: very short patch repair endonuclease [unclassified Mesorhizobium]TPK95289.1 DNA mismatch endonuclease Vsr [Mesorhizobium sp. B2-4-16]TPL60984.1 DNA mismatch endonuclease Vsr [Mesorhizobium sp. B2-4-3]
MKSDIHTSTTDVHSPEVRSYNMSRIRGRNTRPEMLIRTGLHARGFRFRLQVRELPGRPDLVFPKWRAVLLVHGCFWHGHNCHLFRLPATRQDFWASKIAANKERDARSYRALADQGWRTLTLWECAIRGRGRWPDQDVLDACETFLTGTALAAEISGGSPHLGEIG